MKKYWYKSNWNGSIEQGDNLIQLIKLAETDGSQFPVEIYFGSFKIFEVPSRVIYS